MIRFSGLASGLDTEGIIKELMKAERTRVESLQKEQTKIEWKKEVWEDFNTELYSFYTKDLFKFKSQGTYLEKNVAISNESALSISPTVNTVKGIHTMEISNLAKNSFLAGNEITQDENGNPIDATLATKAGDLYDFSVTGSMDIDLSISADGVNFTDVTINTSDSIKQIIEKIQDANEDIQVSFDENYNRFFFSTKDTGEDKVIQIRGANGTDGETGLLNALGFSSNYEVIGSSITEDKNGNSISPTGATRVSELFDFTGILSIGIKDSSGTYQTVDIADADILNDLKAKIEAVDPNISFALDETTGKLSLGANYEVDIKMADGTDIVVDSDQDKLLTKLGFNVNGEVSSSITGTKGEDAAFSYNGVNLTSDSNEVSVNGMTVTLKTETTSEVTINISQDTDAIYQKVKDFLKSYNELVDKLDTKYSADSAKGYEPLTDEEKKSMDEDTIKEWEEKIKGSLLRRESILFGLSSSMRSIMTASVGIDLDTLPEGFKMLSDIGIVTGDYKEKGKLHIMGDEEDITYALEDNKLKEAIESDPDKVIELLTSVGDQLYSMMQEKMKSTEISSALTFYNDKQLDDKIDEYEDKIYRLEDRLVDIENRYYKQFTAMEQMMQKMQAQSEQFMSMFGGA